MQKVPLFLGILGNSEIDWRIAAGIQRTAAPVAYLLPLLRESSGVN